MTEDPEHRAASSYQRRIGERHAITVPFRWRPIPAGRRLRKPRTLDGVTDNLSLSGIAFVADTVKDVRRGSPVWISIDTAEATAIVRTVRAADVPYRTYYAVEFRDPAMLEVIAALIRDHDAPPRAPGGRIDHGPLEG